MGLMIHSLGELPIEAERGYYIYLLDYGWDEPIANALHRNFPKMAGLASSNDAVVMMGIVGSHFDDEVLSWHHVNGQPGEEMLPAILITTRHPRQFIEQDRKTREIKELATDRMLLIPLRKVCQSPTDVVILVEKIFKDIKDKKALTDFKVAQELSSGKKGAIVDALVLEPNFAGIGIDLKYILKFLLGKRRT